MGYRPSTSPLGTATIGRKTNLTLDPLTTEVDEGTTVTYTGKLTEASGPNIGTGIAGKTIHFFVDGTDTGVSAITDANGNFSLDYTWAAMGNFTYEVRYLGD